MFQLILRMNNQYWLQHLNRTTTRGFLFFFFFFFAPNHGVWLRRVTLTKQLSVFVVRQSHRVHQERVSGRLLIFSLNSRWSYCNEGLLLQTTLVKELTQMIYIMIFFHLEWEPLMDIIALHWITAKSKQAFTAFSLCVVPEVLGEKKRLTQSTVVFRAVTIVTCTSWSSFFSFIIWGRDIKGLGRGPVVVHPEPWFRQWP